ncbi:F26L bisphosphatase, partial [Leptocoma aspasia]|nr:F26L bisphosphatase [Leptocoma aspasia]
SGLSYIKIFDVGVRYLANRVQGHVQSRTVYYLMNIHATPRKGQGLGHTPMLPIPCYGVRTVPTGTGPGKATPIGQIPSPHRSQYAQALAQFIRSQDIRDLKEWTSHMKRTIQTAEALGVPYEQWKALNEIDA